MHSIGALPEPAEIIVVDDGSEPRVNLRAPGVTILRQPRKGPAAARNLGVSHARGEYLAFTDDDCVVAAGWLAALRSALERRPAGLIGGTILNGEPHNWAAVFNHHLLDGLRQVTEGTPRWFLPSNNLAMRADAFARLGGFDESFPTAGGEDRDLCERWRRLGGEIAFEPDAAVIHHHPQGIGEFWAMHKRYGAAARRLAQRRTPCRQNGCAEAGPTRGIDKLRLYQVVSERQPVSRLALSQLAVLTGYLEAPER